MDKLELSSNIICMFYYGVLVGNSQYSEDVLELGKLLIKGNNIVTLENLSKHYEDIEKAR